jgi:hypothetical protein
MPIAIKSMAARGCFCVLLLAAAACSPRRIPPMTVTDLMEDRVTLDGVLMKCNQNQSKARSDSDCLNARIAIERLANRNEQAEEAKRAEEFEHRREQRRRSQEKQRQEQDAKTKVDAYHLPLVPVEPTQPTPSSGANSPIMSQSKP